MTNTSKITSKNTEQNIENNNFLKLIPEKVARYKSAFNSLALGVLLSTGITGTEAKAADTFDNLREATKYYNAMNNRLNKVTDRVEYLEEYADRNNARIEALELKVDLLSRDNNSYKKNTEVERNNNYGLKVDISIGGRVFVSGSKIESSIIKGNLVKIDAIIDIEGDKYSFDKDYWIERQYVDLNS